eukprot:5693569-Amphidinium_carterae.1
MDNPTDPRHGYYNFHKEVQYAITNFINLYVYNHPEDYAQTTVQFTQARLLLRGSTYDRQIVRTDDNRHEDADRKRPTYVDGTHAKTLTT